MSKIDEIMEELIDCGRDSLGVTEVAENTKQQLYEAIKAEMPKYNSKTSRNYFQANPNPIKAHKNGYRLAIRDITKVLDKMFGSDDEPEN